MIKVLLEGRDAPLYHCTDLTSAVNILISNELRPSMASDPATGKRYPAVCFTRDKMYIVHEASSIIQLVFDQARLITKYKVRPVSEPGFDREESEKEERIATKKPIPVKPYLIEIDIVPGNEKLFAAWVRKAIRKPGTGHAKDILALVDWWANEEFRFGPRIRAIFEEYEDELL